MDEMLKEFVNPDRKYTPLAFWFLNGKLEEDQLRWQIDEMVEKGVYGGFMHSRAYLETQYLEQDWWDAIEACVDEAKKTGFQAWLYDEYAWPSGTAGSTFDYGFQKPSRTLSMGTQNKAKGLYAKKFDTEEAAKLADCNGDTLVKTFEKDGEVYAFYCKIFPKAVDYLNPDTIKEFIRLTHEEYKARFGEEFGKCIPGIFFDEIYMMGNPIPWTERLEEKFKERFQYDLMEYLPCLIEGEDEFDRKVRKDYFELIATMYEEAFFKQISEWCAENNLDLTGHTEEFLWEQPRRQGNYFKTMKHLMIPGADCHDYRYRFPRKITFCESKYAVSVARAYGKERAMSEAFGGAGWNCPLEEIKRGINTLAAMGINMYVLHGFYYECNHQGTQSDWPTSFFYQNPYWPHFKTVADYMRRISYMNSIGKPSVAYALYYPIEWMNECMVDGEENLEGMRGSDAFHAVLNEMIERQMDVDFIDTECLLNAEIIDGKLCVGNQQFKAILLPKEMVVSETLAVKLHEWEQVGGTAVYYQTEGNPIEAVDEIQNLVKPDVKVIAGCGDEVYINHRQCVDYDQFFVGNSSREVRSMTLEFQKEGFLGDVDTVELLNIETGETVCVMDWKSTEDTIAISLKLEVAEAVYLVFSKKQTIEKRLDTTVYKSWNEDWVMGQWDFEPITLKDDYLEIPLMNFGSSVQEGSRPIWLRDKNNKVEWDGLRSDRISLWDASWITRRESWHDQQSASDLYFYKDFTVTDAIVDAKFCVVAVDSYEVYLNGELVSAERSDATPITFDGTKFLKVGENRIAVHVMNQNPTPDVNFCSAKELPKDRSISLLLQGEITTASGLETIVSDQTWNVIAEDPKNWKLLEDNHTVGILDVQKIRNFNTEKSGPEWLKAWERGKPPILPWGELPLFGENITYPVNLYYSIVIPAGCSSIEMPDVDGDAIYLLDGKPVVWVNGVKAIANAKEKQVLTIQVTAQSENDGLNRPVRVKMAPRKTNLVDWQLCGLSWYSGVCSYKNTFQVKLENAQYKLDLGQINFHAEVWINGIKVGTRIWQPYEFNVTEYLKDGMNEIEVRVSNTAGNERRHMLVEEGKALGWNQYWNEDNMDRDGQNFVSGLLGPVRILKGGV